MRGKRSKQYRKLMHQYALHFNFREPYQVLVDADMIKDCARFKMDLAPALERTFHGKVKPMITQCSIRHLYKSESTDCREKDAWIETAKTFERRRCNHHELEDPLTTVDCLQAVVDPKSSATNKHRYAVATQDQRVRALMREIPGVPLVYVNRSVMILEPMAARTEQFRDREERSKIRAGLKGGRSASRVDEPGDGTKRKRGDDDNDDEPSEPTSAQLKKRKVKAGPKGPNPLSVKKSKAVKPAVPEISKDSVPTATEPAQTESSVDVPKATTAESLAQPDGAVQKKKRKRRHKTAAEAQDINAPLESNDLDSPLEGNDHEDAT